MKGIGRFAKNIFNSIADAGENFIDDTLRRGTPLQRMENLCRDIVSHKGVASGMALAREVVNHYRELDTNEKLDFFHWLADDFGPNIEAAEKSAKDFLENPGEQAIKNLRKITKSRRYELFNRMNMAPDGTEAVVELRKDLLQYIKKKPALGVIDTDLKELLKGWFNPGFLELRRIDWETEASILEKIIRYETVHNIANWHDLKMRLVENRRCFAFFHPALEDEPLIFVEVALTRGIAASMDIVFEEREMEPDRFNTAIFYSINNCQQGLAGIPLGNFLIKRVVAEIEQEIPSIRKFSSLSPVTGFSKWLISQTKQKKPDLPELDKMMLMLLNKKDWHTDTRAISKLKKPLMQACAHYLVREKERERPINGVARFHFGNGAELYRINWMGNTTPHGLQDSFGIMVNYRYDPKDIESNHEKYIGEGKLAISKS
ncbi:MAG: malonyl-CoA decarboxylase, partial [bacterium]